MADSDEETFEQVDAGASMSHPIQAGHVRKGAHVLINGFPCKVVDTATSKTGKHGSAKVVIVGLDIFTGKKMETMSPSTHNLEQPEVSRKIYTLISVDDDTGAAALMDDNGTMKEDLDIEAGELRETAKKLLDSDSDVLVEVLSSMGTEKIMVVKKASGEAK